VAGIVGGLLTGVFATNLINTAGRNGLLHGNVGQLGVQAVGVVAASVYAGAMTWGIYKLVDVTMGLRVTAEQEEVGLDLTQHGETAYHALNA
jgi:Amt family ammonium transporter